MLKLTFKEFLETPTGRILISVMARKTAVFGLGLVVAPIILATTADLISPYNPYTIHPGDLLQPPSGKYLLGTDNLGRDVLSRVIHGSRISLTVGAGAVALALPGGLFLGAIAGYKRGKLDVMISWAFDLVLSFPGILLAILLVTVIGTGYINVIYVLGISVIPVLGRVVRGATLSIREKEFIEAARVAGFSDVTILLKNIIPNVMAPVLVLISITMAGAIIAEAGLSFLGIGTQPPLPSWGADLRNGLPYLETAPWMAIFPGVAIMVTVLALNMLGDGLRDALDPRLRV